LFVSWKQQEKRKEKICFPRGCDCSRIGSPQCTHAQLMDSSQSPSMTSAPYFEVFFFSFTFFCGFSPRLLKEFPEGLTLFSMFCLRYRNLLLISRSREQAKVSFSDGTN
jgi:hypothetical protein